MLIAVTLAAFLIAAAPAGAALTFVRTWGSAGSGPGQFQNPQGITVDSQGEVWVADSNNSRIQHFDADGNLLNAFGSFGSGNGQFSGPHGVAVGPDGFVYVADTGNGRIQKFDRTGAFITSWDGDGTTAGRFSLPDGVAVGPGNVVYVSDGNNDRIQVFDATGFPISQYGSTGSGDGQLSSPFAIAADARDNTYIADTSNHRIEKFDNGPNFALNFTPPDGFGNPVGVAVDESGVVWAADSSKHRIVAFDPSGGFLLSLGSQGTDPGTQFGAPFGVAARAGRLYVVESNNSRVSQFAVTPDPVLGSAMTAEVVSGSVLARVPGAKTFTPVTAATSFPVGTVIDARKGRVRITATAGGKTFSGEFYEGIFQIAQRKKNGATADLKLFGGSFKGCPKAPKASAAAGRKKSIRHLWGQSDGRFRTVGRFSSAAVRGTTWLTDDQCTGTLTKVTAGAVTVRDFVKRKNVVVRAGTRYFARARGR